MILDESSLKVKRILFGQSSDYDAKPVVEEPTGPLMTCPSNLSKTRTEVSQGLQMQIYLTGGEMASDD
jgi:hypothetical protein